MQVLYKSLSGITLRRFPVSLVSSAPSPPADELRKNRVFAALPLAEQQRWLLQAEPVHLHAGQVLSEPGSIPTHILFPVTAIVSFLYETESGASAEVAVVGNEGLVGLAFLMSGQSTPSRAIVRSAGTAWRLPAHTVKEAFDRAENVRRVLLQYALTLIAQMAQTAACNRRHPVEQQLCRWLLLSLDRLQGDEIVTTQEQIAQMLGVRRESVTEAALKLQHAGLVRYARGHVAVLDRPGLEARSCECYAVVRREQDRLMPRPRSPNERDEARSTRRVARA